MFEALGGCLAWLCALDALLEDRSGYKSQRNNDSASPVRPGLRHARNAVLHGDAVLDVAGSETVPTARVVVAGAGVRSQVVTPAARMVWVFRATLRPLYKRDPDLKAAYDAYVAGAEVLVPLRAAIDWLDRARAAP